MTITGTNFGATQGASTVAFNGVIGAPLLWSNTSITVKVPAGATTGLITVNAPGRTDIKRNIIPGDACYYRLQSH